MLSKLVKPQTQSLAVPYSFCLMPTQQPRHVFGAGVTAHLGPFSYGLNLQDARTASRAACWDKEVPKGQASWDCLLKAVVQQECHT